MTKSRSINVVFLGAICAFANITPAAEGDDAASAVDAPPKESFLTSLKQAFRQDFDKEVVFGHFDIGTPNDSHRYYCLIDAKSGYREPNGVSGETQLRKDGMTGIKPGAAVSLYSCEKIEAQGNLVTTGYVLRGNLSATGSAAAPAPRAVVVRPPTPSATVPADTEPANATSLAALAGGAASLDTAPGKIDVAGVRLGMSVDDVRAVLKSKRLLEFHESALTLGDGGRRYTNMIAAWTLEIGDSASKSGESFQVVFTPVPGHETVMAIVRTVFYPSSSAMRAATLDDALSQKYGARSQGPSSTWRLQSDGSIQAGDGCQRRSLYGGPAELTDVAPLHTNVALKTTPDEFRFQIERCGVAIVTADETLIGNADSAGRDTRAVSRLTVSAYSPSIAFEGSTSASQLLQTRPAKAALSSRSASVVPNL